MQTFPRDSSTRNYDIYTQVRRGQALTSEQFEFLKYDCRDQVYNPLIRKDLQIYTAQTVNEKELELVNNNLDRLPFFEPEDEMFRLSNKTRLELKSMSSFDRGKQALKYAKSWQVELYKQQVRRGIVQAPELLEDPEDPVDVQSFYFSRFRFRELMCELDELCRIRGAGARDVWSQMLKANRIGWADAISRRYLSETEAQQSRRNPDADPFDWKTNVRIDNPLSQKLEIRIQLAEPETRWMRAGEVQREAALAQIRWAIHCLSKAACTARQSNPYYDWVSDGPVMIPEETKQHWEDALDAMTLFKKMATRFCDANERQLHIHAVIWELYHNPYHCSPKTYLDMLSNHSTENDQLMTFLHSFNSAEKKFIHENAIRAWVKVQGFFLFKASFVGISATGYGSVGSCNALFNFLTWWREHAAFRKSEREVQAEMVGDEIPEEERDFQAELFKGDESAKWNDLTDEEKQHLNQAWARGVEQSRLQAIRDNEARRKREEEARNGPGYQDQRSRSENAFLKPNAIDSFAVENYQSNNPDYVKQKEASDAARLKRKAASDAKKKEEKEKEKETLAHSSSGAGTSADPISDSVSSEDEEECLALAKRARVVTADNWDDSDESDSE